MSQYRSHQEEIDAAMAERERERVALASNAERRTCACGHRLVLHAMAGGPCVAVESFASFCGCREFHVAEARS